MTTLNAIRSFSPCTYGYTKLLKHLKKTKGDNDPLSLLTILESNGLDDAIWCLRTEQKPERTQRFILALSRRVEHLSTAAKTCNDVVERYLNGEATTAELNAAQAAAAQAAQAAAQAAARAARAAARVTYAAADTAAYAAAYAAVDAAVNSAARAAAYAVERAAQVQLFKDIFA
jgi:hypothetical protein